MAKQKLNDGIHDIPNEVYHASEGVSRSALKLFKKSPYHYWYEYLNPDFEKSPPTPSMIIGEAVHTLTLEAHLFNDRFVIPPEINKRTKAGKEEWEAWQRENEGKQLLTKEQFDTAVTMAHSLSKHELITSIYEDAVFERSIYFTHQATGIQCKARPDVWNYAIVADLKTTADAGLRAFRSSAYKFDYFLQIGMIHEALKSLDITLAKFFIAAVENNKPYASRVFVVDDDAVSHGVDLFDSLMERLKVCCDEDKWPSYEPAILNAPWSMNDEE